MTRSILILAATVCFTGVLPKVAFAADYAKELNCYSKMNKPSRAPNLVMDEKLAIHPIDGRSFYAISKASIKVCRVPSTAPLAPDADEKTGPWLVKLKAERVPFHFQYPQSEEHTALKGAPPFKTPICKDLPKVTRKKAIAKFLEDRIAESRQTCAEGPKLADCLSEFVGRLKSCEGIGEVSDYVSEIGRSALVHARPARSGPDNQSGTQ